MSISSSSEIASKCHNGFIKLRSFQERCLQGGSFSGTEKMFAKLRKGLRKLVKLFFLSAIITYTGSLLDLAAFADDQSTQENKRR